MTEVSGQHAISRLLADIQVEWGRDNETFALNNSVRLKSIQEQIQRAHEMLAEAQRQAAAARQAAQEAMARAAEAQQQAEQAARAAQAALQQALATANAAKKAADQAVALAESMRSAAAAGSDVAQAAIEAAEAALQEAHAVWEQASQLALEMGSLAGDAAVDARRAIARLEPPEVLPAGGAIEPPVVAPVASPRPRPTLGASLTDEPIFDSDAYLALNPDVAEELQIDAEIQDAELIATRAEAHWIQFGIEAGLQGSYQFDSQFFLKAYPGIAETFDPMINPNLAAARLFASEGTAAGMVGALDPRIANDPQFFDAEVYLATYPDLGAHGIDTAEEAKTHWLEYGIFEGRLASEEFYSSAYLARYPAVREHAEATGLNPHVAALDHYVKHGDAAGLSGAFDIEAATSPELFEPDYYLDRYPDLGRAGIDTAAEARAHWLTHGIFEDRVGSPTFEGSVLSHLGLDRVRRRVPGIDSSTVEPTPVAPPAAPPLVDPSAELRRMNSALGNARALLRQTHDVAREATAVAALAAVNTELSHESVRIALDRALDASRLVRELKGLIESLQQERDTLVQEILEASNEEVKGLLEDALESEESVEVDLSPEELAALVERIAEGDETVTAEEMLALIAWIDEQLGELEAGAGEQGGAVAEVLEMIKELKAAQEQTD